MDTNRVEAAVDCFRSGFSCSQAILSTYGPALGLERALALRLGGAFTGGMGRLGRTCGAVTGALMVIGLKYGPTAHDDKEAKANTFGRVQDLVRQFEARRGSTVCESILGCQIGTPEGMQFARQHNLFTTVCPELVRAAAEILEDVL